MAILNTKIRYFLQSSNAAWHLNSVGTVIFSSLIMKFPGQLEVINLYDTLRFYWGWGITKSKYQWTQIWKTLFPFMSPNSLQTLEKQWLKIARLDACVSSCKCSQRIIAQMSKLTQRKLQGRVPDTKENIFPSQGKWETVFRKMLMPCSHRWNVQVPKGPYSSKNCEINKDRVSEKKQFFQKTKPALLEIKIQTNRSWGQDAAFSSHAKSSKINIVVWLHVINNCLPRIHMTWLTDTQLPSCTSFGSQT